MKALKNIYFSRNTINLLVLFLVSFISLKCTVNKEQIIGVYQITKGQPFYENSDDEHLCLLNDSIFVFCGREENCYDKKGFTCHSFTKGKWNIVGNKITLKTRSYEEGADTENINDYFKAIYPKDSIMEQAIYVIGGVLKLKIVNSSQLKLEKSTYIKLRENL